MDYDKFKKEYEAFEEWNKDKEWEYLDNQTFKNSSKWDLPNLSMYNQADLKDGQRWLKIVEGYDKVGPVDNDGNFYDPEEKNDLVNSPAHYTRGNQECIDTIEEAIQDAPDPVTGSAHGHTLRYLIRLWLKENPLRDAKKARWYLDRLISKLEDNK